MTSPFAYHTSKAATFCLKACLCTIRQWYIARLRAGAAPDIIRAVPSRKISLILALLAFVLATPAVRALCDAACTSGSSGHHAAAPAAAQHHGHHELVLVTSATHDVALSAADPGTCSVPALDALASAKTNDLRGLAPAPDVLVNATRKDQAVASPRVSASPPDTSPPSLFALRI